MERKLNVALVLGAHYSRRLLDVFSPISDILEVRALGLLNDICPETYLTEIPLQTFIEDPHLAGFMLGVEEELAKAELIVASGLSDASTYQAFRFAYHQRKPFLLFCQKEEELKKAMLEESDEFQDCLRNASGFLVYQESVAETLEFMGVPPERIHRLRIEVEVRKFGFHEKLRTKFRNYLKVGLDENLIVTQLSDNQVPFETMAAMKALESIDPQVFGKTKLLFVGHCVNKEAVRYRAVDLNLTKSIMFISQDIKPFFSDLMSSTDLFLALGGDLDMTDGLFNVLEAMASGVKVLVGAEHPLEQLLDPQFIVRMPQNLAVCMRDALLLRKDRAEIIRLVTEQYGSGGFNADLLEFFRCRMVEQPSLLPLAGDFTAVLQELNLLARENMTAFERSFETEMQRWGSHSDYKGRLLVLKGQKLISLSLLDEAMAVFELCTGESSVQREAFLGLAKIAFLAHSNEEAMAFYRKALALKPNDPEAMGGIGNIYRKIGMAYESVYWLGKAVSVDVEHSKYLSSLTQACLESEDCERSISLLEQLKVLLGNKPALVMCLGQLYFTVGNNLKGKEMVDLALEITTQSTLPSLSV